MLSRVGRGRSGLGYTITGRQRSIISRVGRGRGGLRYTIRGGRGAC